VEAVTAVAGDDRHLLVMMMEQGWQVAVRVLMAETVEGREGRKEVKEGNRDLRSKEGSEGSK
jgi:hypothetical protein